MNPTALALVIVGSLISIIGALILLNLQSIKKCINSIFGRMDKQDERIEQTTRDVITLSLEIKNCKLDCTRSFVDSETFLRETGFHRRTLENISKDMAEMKGNLKIVDKLPQICGDISRNIVKEMKG